MKRAGRFDPGCHWLCPCFVKNAARKPHWQSQWHTTRDPATDKSLVVEFQTNDVYTFSDLPHN